MAKPRYWRMQLHPNDRSRSMRYTAESIAAGFIGLDFLHARGDMRTMDRRALAPKERRYLQFLEMGPGDLVLAVVHHFPFALVAVRGDYNHISEPDSALGIWFRHFRRIDRERTVYFADVKTNAKAWPKPSMVDTILPLRDAGNVSYRVIEAMAARMPPPRD